MADVEQFVWKDDGAGCHSLIADGVLCRWWGTDDQRPRGATMVEGLDVQVIALQRDLAQARAEAAKLIQYGDDVAAALSATMDAGEVQDAEAIEHCQYVIGRWADLVNARAALEPAP